MSQFNSSVYDAISAVEQELVQSIQKTEEIKNKYNKLIVLKNAFKAYCSRSDRES